MIAFNLYNPESVAVIIVVWGVFHILRCFISSITNQIMVLRYYYWLWLICVCFREWLGRLMCLKCLRYYIIKPDLLLFYNCLKFVFLHNLRQTTNFHMINRIVWESWRTWLPLLKVPRVHEAAFVTISPWCCERPRGSQKNRSITLVTDAGCFTETIPRTLHESFARLLWSSEWRFTHKCTALTIKLMF